MNTRHLFRTSVAALIASLWAGHAQAAAFTLSLSGDTSAFTDSHFDSGGFHYDRFDLDLTGLDSSNAITVSQGDTISSTITLNNAYTIAGSVVRTDLLHFLRGSAFPVENTGVSGTFNFYDGATLVESLGYGSTSGNQLSSFQILFPPDNVPFTFDSFTNDLTIDTLATPATLDASAFEYNLISNAASVPEPITLSLFGVGLAGAAALRRRKVKKA